MMPAFTISPRLYTEEEVDAAMCIWEECLMRQISWKKENGPYPDTGPPLFDWLRGGEGAAAARDMCIMLAPDVEACWLLAHDEFGFDDSFDWEFVPRWLDHAMELTETHHLTPTWLKYLAYKVTEDWRETSP
jgi:hypothetical protein